MSAAYRENYQLIDWSKELRAERKERTQSRFAPLRSALSAPMVIGDAIEVKSMADGAFYTSKAKLRRSYRELGYIEIGNEKQTLPKRKRADRREISDSVEKAFARAGI